MDAPLVVARLLADEAPQELDAFFAAAGASLFPTELSELNWRCTCPDWENPCKHALALCYDFAAHLDANPSLLLTLRGQTIESVTALIQARWASAPGAVADADTPTTATTAREQPQAGAAFYQAGPALDEFTVSLRPPDEVAALLRSIGKPPFAGDREDPITPLTQVYQAITEQALRTLGRATPKSAAD